MQTEFSQDEMKRPMPEKPPVPLAATELSNLSRRLRSLEEHYGNLIKKTEVTDSNMIAWTKKLALEIKTINSEMSDMSRDVAEMKEKFVMIVHELQMCAKKEEVKVIERYLNLFEPLNFVTRNQVEKIVKEILENRQG